MRCYRCNSVLSENDFCNSCGANVTVYKKVVKLSNAYYNMGLAKAQIRDLTGACDLLRRSVRFDKRNTNARNLLGLVYYEMGEAVQAFSEWVISKNIQPEKNVADDYIKRLQSNPVRLDTINQTMKKYNHALEYAKSGNDDVAVIQLKKVLNTNPNLVKGHLLLALLYMKKGEYEKARKPIMKALRIDTSNPLAKHYLIEIDKEVSGRKTDIEKASIREIRKEEVKQYSERDIANNLDISIPRKSGYSEYRSGMFTVINVVIGIVIGVASAYFLLIPARKSALETKHQKQLNSVYSQNDTLTNQLSDMENQLSLVQAQKDELQNQLTSQDSENNSATEDFNNLLSAMESYKNNDYIACAESLKNINKTDYSEIFTKQYDDMKKETYKQAAVKSYEKGKNTLSKAKTVDDYENAITELSDCFTYDFMSANYVDAADKLGTAYEKQYFLALTQDVNTAGQYKQNALEKMSNLINNVLHNTENVNSAAEEKLQEHIAKITSK